MQNKIDKENVLLYHGSCSDGFCSAFLFWLCYKDNMNYIASYYGEKAPDLKDKNVFIADFSFDKETILRIIEECKSLVWLDHHQSSAELMREIKQLNNPKVTIIEDNNRSGAGIVFDYIRENMVLTPELSASLMARETLVNYIQDNDLWQFKLPDSKAFSIAERSYKMKFEEWDNFNVQSLIEEGKVMLKYYNSKLEDIYRLAYEKEVFGYKILMVNCNGMFASDIVNMLCKDRPFGISWWYDGKRKKFVFSMRSDSNGVDVSELAKRAGGGGHKNSSGFQLSPEEVDSIIDLE